MIISPCRKTYVGRTVLHLPEIELENGRIYALIGPNGSGKSTCGRIISGIEKPDDGKTPADGICVGYLPQKSYAFRMTVIKNMLLNGGDREKAEKLLGNLGLSHLSSARAKKLSGGESARMAIARLMMKEYDLVILDEPTASMDMESTLITERLIKTYCVDTHCAVLLITHSLQQARRIADNVIFIKDGELVEQGSAEKLLYRPDNPKTVEFLEFYGI